MLLGFIVIGVNGMTVRTSLIPASSCDLQLLEESRVEFRLLDKSPSSFSSSLVQHTGEIS